MSPGAGRAWAGCGLGGRDRGAEWWGGAWIEATRTRRPAPSRVSGRRECATLACAVRAGAAAGPHPPPASQEGVQPLPHANPARAGRTRSAQAGQVCGRAGPVSWQGAGRAGAGQGRAGQGSGAPPRGGENRGRALVEAGNINRQAGPCWPHLSGRPPAAPSRAAPTCPPRVRPSQRQAEGDAGGRRGAAARRQMVEGVSLGGHTCYSKPPGSLPPFGLLPSTPTHKAPSTAAQAARRATAGRPHTGHGPGSSRPATGRAGAACARCVAAGRRPRAGGATAAVPAPSLSHASLAPPEVTPRPPPPPAAAPAAHPGCTPGPARSFGRTDP